MNVPLKMANAISTGRATELRLPCKEGKGCPVKIGGEHPVQPSDRPKDRTTICRVKALSAQGQLLGDVTFAEVRAMAFKTTDDWRIAWVRWQDRSWVKALEGLLPDDVFLSDDELLDRFATHWAGKVAWKITVQLVNDRPRYLARVGGYTATPALAIDDLECVDAATQKRISDQALSFCIGRQLARQKEQQEKRKQTKAERHPAPWWEQAA